MFVFGVGSEVEYFFLGEVFDFVVVEYGIFVGIFEVDWFVIGFEW